MLSCNHCGESFQIDDTACASCGKSLVDHGLLDNPRRTIWVWIFSVYLIGSGFTSLFMVPYLAFLDLVVDGPEFQAFEGLYSAQLALTLGIAGIAELIAGALLFLMKKASIPLMIIALIGSVLATVEAAAMIEFSGPVVSLIAAALFSIAVQIAGILYALRLSKAGVLGWTPGRNPKGFSYQ